MRTQRAGVWNTVGHEIGETRIVEIVKIDPQYVVGVDTLDRTQGYALTFIDFPADLEIGKTRVIVFTAGGPLGGYWDFS